jgi:archaellum component FlaF (FlaF/FlaG flagellin family)
MGFSLVVSSVIIGITVLITLEILTGDIIPSIAQMSTSYHDLKQRIVDQLLTEINITSVAKAGWNTTFLYQKKNHY